jgi:hypothetical protein
MTPRSASVPPLPVCIAMMVISLSSDGITFSCLVVQRLFLLEGEHGERAPGFGHGRVRGGLESKMRRWRARMCEARIEDGALRWRARV